MIVAYEDDPVFVPGKPEVLFSGQYVVDFQSVYDIGPDGQRFLMMKETDLVEPHTGLQQLVVVENWFEELKRLAPADVQ